jgi:bifunctional DNase/RNase
MSRLIEMKEENKWVQIFPYAMVMSPDNRRPILIFKDKKQEVTLPVWLSPLDAGIALSDRNWDAISSPHKLSWSLLKKLDVTLKKAVFSEIKGHHQYLDLNFEGNTAIQKVKARADESISFCLSSECEFYCTKKYANECRVLDSEINENRSRKIVPLSTSVTLN